MNAQNSVETTNTCDDNGEDFATLFASQEQHSSTLHQGQKVSGVVIAITGENVFLDVGIKVDGIMDKKDVTNADGEVTVAVGDTVEAYVVGMSSQEIRISRSMSGSGMAVLEDACSAALPVDGRVVATCKGGYTVEVLGKRAFCPGSQMGMGSGEDADAVVGRTLPFLITKVESKGRNIVVSHRALQERERKENLAALLENIHEGDTVEGTVSRLAAFGAFVEIAPSVEGMVHVSELSWARVDSADAAVSVGDKVRAKVLSIGQDAKGNTRISLSVKQAQGDPWDSVQDRLAAGDVVTGKVIRCVPFGAFIEVLPGIEGLVHISEMSWAKRVTKPEDIVTVGEQVSVKIKEISIENRRISLSLRDAEGDPWAQVSETFKVGSMVTGTVESRAQFGLFVTLAPGVTGLLPNAVIKGSAQGQALAGLNKGDSVTLVVQSIDTAQRRIGLAPEGAAEAEDTSWREHAAPPKESAALGALGQALQAALKKQK